MNITSYSLYRQSIMFLDAFSDCNRMDVEEVIKSLEYEYGRNNSPYTEREIAEARSFINYLKGYINIE